MRVFAALEAAVGAAGLLLPHGLGALERLDTWVFGVAPAAAPLLHLVGLALLLGPAALAMGATLPALGLVATQSGRSIATLYGLNTLGAAAGALLAGFLLIPALGLDAAGRAIAGFNLLVAAVAWVIPPLTTEPRASADSRSSEGALRPALLVAATTGFAVFALEVAWFRAMAAAFHSTTHAFATMLAGVLLALGAAGVCVPALMRRGVRLHQVLAAAAVAVLLATPAIERLDLLMSRVSDWPAPYALVCLAAVVGTTGVPVLLLGAGLPWVLDDQRQPRRWGQVYGANTLASIAGALLAGWVLLPTIGFAPTAWLVGSGVAVAGVALAPRRARAALAPVAALLLAAPLQSGAGRDRALGATDFGGGAEVLEARESPDHAVAAVRYPDGQRLLLIDGFAASGHLDGTPGPSSYMRWMGHLPMLRHPDPRTALVICFGVGQTADAVRDEGPARLDIVDISRDVFALAHHFPLNDDVLADARVRPVVMDGRAFVRRTRTRYDVVTLEPMPPQFAGVNALYSVEFYEQLDARLTEGGVVAQWLPFHLVSPDVGASIARTFQHVFADAVLWIDPSTTGVLLGTRRDSHPRGAQAAADAWPGFQRAGPARGLDAQAVTEAVALDAGGLARYAAGGRLITDDNQLLAFGAPEAARMRGTAGHACANLERIRAVASKPARVPPCAGG